MAPFASQEGAIDYDYTYHYEMVFAVILPLMSASNNPKTYEFVTTIHGHKRVYRVRTVELDGLRWFVIADLKIILGFDASIIVDELRADGHITHASIEILGGSLKGNFCKRPCISMYGLTQIAMRSRKTASAPFLEWVSKEFLVSP